MSDHAELIAELERELDQRRRVYPDQVAKGRLHDREAQHRIALAAEIRTDLVRADAGDFTPGASTWSVKLAELDRELAARRRLYPEWVAKGRLQQHDADRQLALLQRVRDLYWFELLGWSPPPGSIMCWNPERDEYHTPGAQAYRQAVREHMARAHAEAAPADLFEKART